MGRLCLVLTLFLLGLAPARALESAPARSDRATVSLVSDVDSYRPGTPFRLGLRFRLAPGWHTYWRNPGDAGTAPELSFRLGQGARAGNIAWPTPERLREGPLMTYGYRGDTVLSVPVTPGPGGRPLEVEAHAEWLVCERLCVPEQGDFRLVLAPGDAAPSAEAPLFAAAAARVPRPAPFAAHVAPDGTLSLAGPGLSAAAVADAWFLPGVSDAIDQAAPQPVAVGDGVLTIALRPGPSFDPGRGLEGTVVLRDRNGQESALTVVATPGAAPPLPRRPSYGRILLLAYAGGLILNLMPCVFPVLAMKAVRLAALSRAARGAVRGQALCYVAGVLAAFGLLGLVLLGLRAVGSVAGWGFQFQSPLFVVGMAWLLFAIGLNLSGVFEVGGRLAGTGQGLAARGGQAGSFFTGLLAVVVATPCTAPFMGAAIAGALAAPAPLALAVFLVLGLGLASPYALLAAMPGLARLLPRPGAWMVVLREALAFPMYAAATWLAWVAGQQVGPPGMLATVAGAVLLGFAAWALGIAQRAGPPGRHLGHAAALGALLLTGVLLSVLAALPPAASQAAETAAPGAEPFSAARLAALRAEGRPVFVDMTAAWCVTCLVNERVALAPQAVQEAFRRRRVVYMKGDWTRQDPGITEFLRAHGRDGVPLYALYPPGNGAPRLLPQLLTEGEVLGALAQLGG